MRCLDTSHTRVVSRFTDLEKLVDLLGLLLKKENWSEFTLKIEFSIEAWQATSGSYTHLLHSISDFLSAHRSH